ncbi:hypothetical protein C5C34_00620 [Rathayibacter rathayi]|nr:hypothetical protein C5C34_00620 [Rathayibacter rathayi]PPG95393.1 hypothetical protein C5C22_05835 [Rathayibacter rathayi]
MTTHLRARRHRLGRRFGTRILLACIGVCATLGMLSAGAAPAGAEPADAGPGRPVSEFREQIPIQAGSFIAAGKYRCTVGAVLVSTSFYAAVSPKAKATRYIVTAGHCGNVGDPIRVNLQGIIGSVIWKSTMLDVSIARIDPIGESHVGCDPSSSLHRCTVATSYMPRATGRIFLFDHFGRYASLPVIGMGVPSVNEVFCTSGARTGVNCSWGVARLPPAAPIFVLGARTFRNQVLVGDSGGPVAGRDGRLYGIVSEGLNWNDSDPDLMTYVPISRILEEQRGYALAPVT